MFSVAIDGPSGAGKSSIAKAVSEALGFIYVDTGALYRAVGLYLLRNGITPSDREAVEKALGGIDVGLEHGEDGQRVFLNGEDVTGMIRGQEVSMAASDCSALPCVRAFLFELQRDMARRHNVIMDGRDIGTVVLPEADVKIFLTASVHERAKRRCAQLEKSGGKTSFAVVLDEVKKRDAQDSSRATAPLRQAEDAVLVDTTELDFEESVGRIKELIEAKYSRE